jgi:hypothetical protein
MELSGTDIFDHERCFFVPEEEPLPVDSGLYPEDDVYTDFDLVHEMPDDGLGWDVPVDPLLGHLGSSGSAATNFMTEVTALNEEFFQPVRPQDEWARDLYKQYGLGLTPTMQEIEPVALWLLDGSYDDAHRAFEMVLGRIVGMNEMEAQYADLIAVLDGPASPAEKFSCLWMEKISLQEDAVKAGDNTADRP